MRRGNTKKGFALGALVGGLCGGMSALLFASTKKGKLFCKDMCKKYHAVSDKACDFCEDAKEKGEDLVHRARSLISLGKKNNGKRRRR